MFGIISATRAPFPQPRACSQPPNAVDSASSSANVIDLPMHVYAGRAEYLAMLSSNTSRTDAYSPTSMSAGTPFGYCLSQILSTMCSSRMARAGSRARRFVGQTTTRPKTRAITD